MIPISLSLRKFYIVPLFIFCFTLFFQSNASLAQEKIAGPDTVEVEICSKSSKIIIASDGGNLDISSLKGSILGIAQNDGDPIQSVIDGLGAECGYKSIISINGDSLSVGNSSSRVWNLRASVIAPAISDKTLNELLIESCSYDAVLIEDVQEDNCDQKLGFVCEREDGSTWVDTNGFPYIDVNGFPYIDVNGFPFVDVNGFPYIDVNGFPFVDIRESACNSEKGFPFVDLNGFPFVDGKGFPYIDANGFPYIDVNGFPFVDVRSTTGTVRIMGLSQVESEEDADGIKLLGFPFVDVNTSQLSK